MLFFCDRWKLYRVKQPWYRRLLYKDRPVLIIHIIHSTLILNIPYPFSTFRTGSSVVIYNHTIQCLPDEHGFFFESGSSGKGLVPSPKLWNSLRRCLRDRTCLLKLKTWLKSSLCYPSSPGHFLFCLLQWFELICCLYTHVSRVPFLCLLSVMSLFVVLFGFGRAIPL